MNIQARKLQERLEYVEERASQDKKEFQQQRDHLERTILDLETSRNEAVKACKLDQERLKSATAERDQLAQKFSESFKTHTNEMHQQIEELQQRLRENEELLKKREDDDFRRQIEQSKLNALVEQKLLLTETELKDYKGKWSQKEADLRELNKELM
jgi:hypothetical protein